ncbi:MAG: hypothetical protein R2712_26465 [Vicinamibacterales bacterium]
MRDIPSGTELVRPFVPTRDFDLSKRFYEALGFEKRLDGEVAIFAAGSGGFILQRYYQKEWAENCMLQLMVDDLDAWWRHIEALDLPRQFGVPPPRLPGAAALGPAGWHTSSTRVWGAVGTWPSGGMGVPQDAGREPGRNTGSIDR